MARFFLPRNKMQEGRGIIDGQELEHLRKSLRLVPGDHITVFDDIGWEHEAIIRAFGPEQGEVELLRSYQAERESPLEMTLALGFTKGEKMDFVVEKATELGVQTIIPFISAYTVPKLDQKKIEKRADRWQKIALSAAKQSGRTRIPEVLAVCEEFDPPEGYLAEEPEKHVAAAARAVRIVIKRLPADVGDLDPDPTPRR